MAIGLSEEHEALRESVSGWAARNIPAELLRSGSDERPAFWPGLAEQGLLGLHLPEEAGGSGYGLLETAVAVEALAERMAPGPYVPTVLASAVINASKRPEHLESFADGSLTAAVALTGTLTGTLTEDGGLIVSGTAENVLGASLADALVLPVATAEGEEWVIIDASSATVTEIKSLDLTRPVALSL